MNEHEKMKRLIRINIAVTLLAGAIIIILLTMNKTSSTVNPSSKAINEQITSLELTKEVL